MAAEYQSARRDERFARLRRTLALRAMVASGLTQREIAEALGSTQPAISQQLKFAPELNSVDPRVLLEAAAPVLRTLASAHGYSRLAVFGSVARRDAQMDSDVDLIAETPAGSSSFDLVRFKQLLEHVLDREIDLVDYGGLTPIIDDDVLREAVLL